MTILLKGLVLSVFTAFAGKLICIQHVIFKYNRIMQQSLDNYYETFINTANDVFIFF